MFVYIPAIITSTDLRRNTRTGIYHGIPNAADRLTSDEGVNFSHNIP
jgi:hypothetical protein